MIRFGTAGWRSKVRHTIVNRTALKMFLLFMIGIFVLEVIMFWHSFQRDVDRMSQQKRQNDAETVEHVTEYIQTMINDEIVLNATVAETTWRIMFGEETGVFEEWLTYRRRKQLAEDFLFYIPSGDVLSSRAVFFSGKNEVVTREYWGSINSFLLMKGISPRYHEQLLDSINSAGQLTQIESVDENGESVLGDNIWLVDPLSGDVAGKDFTITLISAKKLEKAIVPMLPDNFLTVRMYNLDSGNTLFCYESGEQTDKVVRSEMVQIQEIRWGIEFLIDDVVLSSSEMLMENQAIYFVIILLTVIVAMLFTMYNYAPLKKIASSLPSPGLGKDIYQSIQHTVEDIVLELEESRKQDLMHRLLAGYFEVSNESIDEDFSIQENTWVEVMIIGDVKKKISTVLQEKLEQQRSLFAAEDSVYMTLQTMEGNILLILGHELREKIEQSLSEIMHIQTEEGFKVFTGRIEQGLLGISKSYQSAMEKMRFVSGIIQPKYYFPIDWIMQWSTAIRQGKNEVAEGIMKAVFAENRRRLEKGEMEKKDYYYLFHRIFEDLSICTKEVGFEEYKSNYEDIYGAFFASMNAKMDASWNELRHIENEILMLESDLCGKVRKDIDSDSNFNQKIIGYIEENYDNPELSVSLLESVFKISANTINKTVKFYTGKTFLPFLTYCRMEQAKLLLAEGVKITDVAVRVGYDNEYSFRRAFQRYVGVKAQNYRV